MSVATCIVGGAPANEIVVLSRTPFCGEMCRTLVVGDSPVEFETLCVTVLGVAQVWAGQSCNLFDILGGDHPPRLNIYTTG